MDKDVNLNTNPEIEEALKKLEEKKVQQASMPEQSLKTDKFSEIPKVVQFVMKYTGGDQKKAEYALLCLIVLAICASIYLFLNMSSVSQAPTPPITVEGPNFLK